MASATWHSPDNGLWVATSSDGYLGMVEATEIGFLATDAKGHQLGEFPDLETAKNIIATESRFTDNREISAALVKTVIASSAAVSMLGIAGLIFLAVS